MAKHALLSASASHRWLNCPPSALACASVEERASPYAQQGTDAHTLCEYKVGKALGRKLQNPEGHLENFDAEMDDCTDEYRNYVLEQLEQAKKFCPDPQVLIEERLDFSRWVPDGFGTGDCVIVSDRELHVIDFKYGVGVLVNAKDNPQMRCYALGALDTYDGIYDIETVKMTIFQPRRDNISTASMGKDELLAWAENTLAPAAKLAYEGGGEFHAGEHCQFCRVKATCRKRAEHNLEMARYDFAVPDTLEPSEIAAILSRIDDLVSWGSDIKDYALQQALSGVKYDGFKVVEGKSNRRFTDEMAVASAVQSAGYEPYEKKILGITAMTSLLGKKKFDELLGGLVMKPPGKPALVPEKDKRPAINTATDDFKEN
ncbi:DUF2800 domain-containing protein [Schaedlerella arabinosiphila]|uniref:DUF2800 domain-containing protein n=1 Tax=Schaedlerella arabinosiphila TaxID=2044587 RepID=UPI002557D689|nr:DUF2800 domain-containing protein [Schaedlerella arabinosiphila]